LTAEAVAGILSARTSGISPVNALSKAKDFNLAVAEGGLPYSKEYPGLLTIEIETARTRRRVAGSIFRTDQPHLVEIDDLTLDIGPDGNTIMLTNIDRPGVVGFVGTILGASNVNIAGYEVGRRSAGGE